MMGVGVKLIDILKLEKAEQAKVMLNHGFKLVYSNNWGIRFRRCDNAR